MGRILCFVPDRFADFEITLALHLLRGVDDREIVTVGYSHDPVTAQSGLRYTADITFDEAAALDGVEAFLMPGGPLCERSELLTAFMQKLNRENALLAAICFAPQYLARSGLLESRRYTTSCTPARIEEMAIADPFPRAGYVCERVVTDGNIITAQGHAFVDFAFAILRYLGIFAKHKAELMEFYADIMDRQRL